MLYSYRWGDHGTPATPLWIHHCTDHPSNFRPISLEPVMLKMFTSFLRDSMYDFLKKNIYIESQIQKGFISKISGTLEHTSMMGHIINKPVQNNAL